MKNMKKNNHVIAVVQTRTGSTRLKGKTLKKICGIPMILLMLERLSNSKLIDKIVVATTTNPNDDELYNLIKDNDYEVFRGSEMDCLDRHFQVGKKFHADYICKITSDDPLIDPVLTDKIIAFFLQNSEKFDYVSNVHPPTFPDGLDVEIVKMESLENAWKNTTEQNDREHTTTFIWSNPSKFKIGNYENKSTKNLFLSERWTVDYPEDFEFVRTVYEELYKKNKIFSTEDILDLLERKPEIRSINKKYVSKNKIH